MVGAYPIVWVIHWAGASLLLFDGICLMIRCRYIADIFILLCKDFYIILRLKWH